MWVWLGYASLRWELFSHLDSYEYSHKHTFIILAKQGKKNTREYIYFVYDFQVIKRIYTSPMADQTKNFLNSKSKL